MRNKIPKKTVYVIIISIFLLGFLMAWRKPGMKFATGFFGGVQSVFSSYVFYVKDTMGSVKYVFASNTVIKMLTEKNIMLDIENQALKKENEKLRKLLGLKEENFFGRDARCTASVIGANTDGFIYYYMIDKGGNDGIKEGDGVIAGGSVLGRVMEVLPEMSRVQLLTDAKSSISARDSRSGVAGILKGSGNRYCSLDYIPREKDIMEGDIIVTSGMTESFPAGIRAGEVVKVDKKTDDLSMKVVIRPFVDVFSVEQAVVLKKQKIKISK